MKTVFAVIIDEQDSRGNWWKSTEKVFSTKEKAKEYIMQQVKKYVHSNDFYTIEEVPFE